MLKELRTKYNYTEQYLAHKLHITQSTYPRLESGKIELSYESNVIIVPEVYASGAFCFVEEELTNEI